MTIQPIIESTSILEALAIAFMIWSIQDFAFAARLIHQNYKGGSFISASRLAWDMITNCFKCSSFHITWILTMDFLLAAQVAFVAWVIGSATNAGNKI
jgi:hypothetical protein